MDIAYQEYKSPLSMHLELTSSCNHKCIHCYNYWREPDDSVGTISRKDLHRIIDNLVESEIQDIIITGGEPLLFPDLTFETIDLAQKNKIMCFLNSNMSLITDEIAAGLSARGVPILTSFPSSHPSIFNKIVNKQGAFDRVVDGIKIAQKHNIHLTANMVVMQENFNQIIDTGRFLHSIGITTFTATKVHPSQTCTQFEGLQLQPYQVKSVFDSLLKLREQLNISIDTLTCYPMCHFEDMEQYGDLLLQRSCTAGKTGGVIGADGGVRPCTHADEVYGNAITESILDIWPRMISWRDGSYIPENCKQCAWIKECGGGCRMDSKFFHKRKDKPDPYMVTNRDIHIILPKKETSYEFDVDIKLIVSPYIRYRKEKFGTIINSCKTVRIVTDDSAYLLQSLTEKSFTIKEIVERHDLDIENTKCFFAELLKNEVVLRV